MDLAADHRHHRATLEALEHASADRGIPVEIQVVPTDSIRGAFPIAAPGSGVVIGPGSPYRDPEAVLEVVRKARKGNIPLVGT